MGLTIAFWITFYIWIGSEAAISVHAKRNRRESSDNNKDKGSFWVIISGVWIGSFFSFMLHFALLHFGRIEHGKSFLISGVCLMLLGVLIRFLAIRTLGRHFNLVVAVAGEQTLVQTGLYKRLRHPSYTGAIITLIGFGVALNSWFTVLFWCVMVWVMYGYRIHIEEKALLEHFGEQYKNYQEHSWRVLPFIW